ncbi:MAG: hypothetical protein ACYSWQ_23800 [Planctomycetota bacterium]|jgi:hypothetical protein
MRSRGKRNSFFGLLAGGLLSLFGKTPDKAELADLQRADFTASTQRLGIRFGKKIRDVFRFRWLRVSRGGASGVHRHSEQTDDSGRTK